MNTNTCSVGTIISDAETPTFELARIKMAAGYDLKPGTLVRIPASRNHVESTLIGRVRSAYEHNPNEGPEDINVRDTLNLNANYPSEEDSTTIYRLVEVDLIEEIADAKTGAPETLPNSGAPVYVANDEEIVRTLGLTDDETKGIYIGETVRVAPH